jgi:hypothetical protein
MLFLHNIKLELPLVSLAILLLFGGADICSDHGPICHYFELILVIHANTSNGTNHIV